MTFHAQITSPLGQVLLCSDQGKLSGLYFMGQSDCPVVPGAMPPHKTKTRPSEGSVKGHEIRKFRARKNVAAGSPKKGESSAELQSELPLFVLSDESTTLLVKGPELAPVANELMFLEGDIPANVRALFAEARQQLGDYFSGTRKAFDIPLHTLGTSFQQKVWQALRTIPYGELVSYADVAQAAGMTRHHGRPVGAAVGQNPITIIIPCHRVVSSSGLLTGYTGGLERKLALLELEGLAVQRV